jgi:hypothetical protein
VKDDAMCGISQEGNPALLGVEDAGLTFLAQVDGKIRFVCDPAYQGFRLMYVEIIHDEVPTCDRWIGGDYGLQVRQLEFVKVAGRSEDNAYTGSRLIGEMNMPKHRVFAIKFAGVYPLYVQKAERKNRTKQEVDQIICWLTGYDLAGLQQQIEQGSDFEAFFAQAPAIHPNSALIKGSVCGVRVEEITEPLMQKIRYLDKLIDELAKGKAMEKILRQ